MATKDIPVTGTEHAPMASNTHLKDLSSDVLYHLGITYSEETKKAIEGRFHNVKFFVIGGSNERMGNFAHRVASTLELPTPFGYTLSPIGSSTRYLLYKVGPVLVASHGMGMPSVSILLHEVTKLLGYAGAKDVVYIRIGTSGGVGVDPGTVVMTTEAVNHRLEAVQEIAVLGETVKRPAICSKEIADALAQSAEALKIPCTSGKTLTSDDFYEGQGRLDGAICEYTSEDKMNYLQRCAAAGVKNVEMEGRAVAAFCHRLNIRVAVICVTLLNRLLGDQVTSSKEMLTSFEERPAVIILNYIKQQVQGEDSGDIVEGKIVQ